MNIILLIVIRNSYVSLIRYSVIPPFDYAEHGKIDYQAGICLYTAEICERYLPKPLNNISVHNILYNY